VIVAGIKGWKPSRERRITHVDTQGEQGGRGGGDESIEIGSEISLNRGKEKKKKGIEPPLSRKESYNPSVPTLTSIEADVCMLEVLRLS